MEIGVNEEVITSNVTFCELICVDPVRVGIRPLPKVRVKALDGSCSEKVYDKIFV